MGRTNCVCKQKPCGQTRRANLCANWLQLVTPNELFGGYPWYHDETILFEKGFPWSRSTYERAALLKRNLISNIDPNEFVNYAYNETIDKTSYLDGDSVKSRRMREMFVLNFYWFMQTLLERKDRMSMANGLEVRVPFCDHRVAEYAYNVPWEFKSYEGREKGLIRRTMKGLLPEDVLWRKKSPYPKTHNPEYFNRVISEFSDVINNSNGCRLTEIFEAGKLQELLATKGKSFEKNWYGQLMQNPQVFAYLIQIEHWLRKYDVIIKI